MANTGAKFASAAANTGTGNFAWANPSNAQAADGAYSVATASSKVAGTTQYLILSNYGFAIPAGATIDGVVATIRRRKTGTSVVNDHTIQLLVSGGLAGSNLAINTWPTTPADASYGGSTNLWGSALTPAIVNASNFGIGIRASIASGVASGRTADVDAAWLDVYYTLPPPPSTAIKIHSYRQRRI